MQIFLRDICANTLYCRSGGCSDRRHPSCSCVTKTTWKRGMEIRNENSSRILSIVDLPTPYSLADVFLQQFLCGPNFSQKLSSSYFCSYLLVQFPEKILSKTRQRRRLAFLSRSAVILEKPGIKIVFQKNVLRAILYLNRIHGSTLSLCKVW